MERHDVLAMMTALKLAGMRAAYDDILADGLKRRHPLQQIIGTLLQTEVADKQARSIKYQMTSAKLPTAKELADFDIAASPVNEPLIQELSGGDFLESKRNIVLVGGTGTGKTHLAVAIARACIRKGARGRFYNVVNLVNWTHPGKVEAPLHRLHCFCLEFDGACEVQRRVPTDWIIEPIDVSGHGSFSLAS